MPRKTILNHVEPFKSFVDKKVRWADPETKTTIEILIEARANSRPICSECGGKAPGYDRLPSRRFGPPFGRCPVPLWQKGHKDLTLVYQIDAGDKRLLWIGQERTAKTFLRFFRVLGQERSSRLKFVCSDTGKPYLKVIAKKAAQAIHVLDRFQIMQKMSKAIDEVRAAEARQLKADGYEPVLKHSRWCLLKRPENLTDKETVKLSELLKYTVVLVQRDVEFLCGFSG